MADISTPAAIAMVLQIATGPNLLTASAARNPANVVTSFPTKLRSVVPPELGDDSFADAYSDGPSSGPTHTFAANKADSLEQGAGVGAIAHIRLHAAGYVLSEAGDPGVTAKNIRYTSGSTAVAACTGSWPVYPSGSPRLATEIVTGDLATKPGGGAWTWDDVNALADVQPEITVEEIAFPGCTNFVNEIWAEVFGVLGNEPRVIRRSEILAPVRQVDSF